MIKLVLSDMDNTIVPLGAGRVTERLRAAVHACLDAGVRFAPATGRDPDGLERFFCGDAACYASMLASNSKVIALDGRLVREVFIDTDDVRRICEMLEPEPDVFCLFRVGDIDYAYGSSDVDYGDLADIFGPDVHVTQELPSGNVIALTVAHAISAERQQEVRAMVEGACPGLVCRAPALGVFDVMPRGWDKASGMQVLMDEMGITVDEVCVFGDSENDLSMICAVPNSVAVANASPEIAEAARWHIGTSESDAVADALFQITDAASRGEMPAFMQG
jgi:HAD superfamily hydrolase (TIGR01484 family)